MSGRYEFNGSEFHGDGREVDNSPHESEDETVKRLAEYWQFNKTGDTHNGIVYHIARDAYKSGRKAGRSESGE